MEKMFYGAAPVLMVSDLHRSLDYYCNILGFERPQLWGDPPDFAMPKREGMILMLSQPKDPARVQPRQDIWDVYYWVRDARSLFEEFVKKGAIVRRELTHQPAYGNLQPIFREYRASGVITETSLRLKTAWGTDEFGLFDLSKNRITFFEDL